MVGLENLVSDVKEGVKRRASKMTENYSMALTKKYILLKSCRRLIRVKQEIGKTRDRQPYPEVNWAARFMMQLDMC